MAFGHSISPAGPIASYVTHLTYREKYDISFVANSLLSPTVKEFLKSANIFLKL